jgi:transposase
MTQTELDRHVRHRLAVLQHAEEVTGNVAMTCRYYGISRQLFYIWKRRFEEEGEQGLVPRSRRPKVSPRATHVDVVGKIIYLRKNDHFGPMKISMYLKRYHDVSISHSGVWRILKRLDMSRLPSSQRYKRLDKRWQRYEKQLPGHQVQIDVKFIEPIKGAQAKKYYQFTAIDDCTRLRVLRIYPRLNQKTAIQFRRLRAREAAVRRSGHPDRQRVGVRFLVPLPRARQGGRAQVHQAKDATAQWQG